jgi:hypothetical protein
MHQFVVRIEEYFKRLIAEGSPEEAISPPRQSTEPLANVRGAPDFSHGKLDHLFVQDSTEVTSNGNQKNNNTIMQSITRT